MTVIIVLLHLASCIFKILYLASCQTFSSKYAWPILNFKKAFMQRKTTEVVITSYT